MGLQLEALQNWVAAALAIEPATISLTQIAGDASPRRYFRVSRGCGAAATASPLAATSSSGSNRIVEGDTLIAALSPGSENNDAFLAVQRLMSTAGLRVPAQIAADLTQGFFLMEDLGDALLSSQLERRTVETWYPLALGELAKLTAISHRDARLPLMDAARIREELSVFPEWFLRRLLGLSDAEIPIAILDSLATYLAEAFSAQTQCVVHRDFHCRNLMCLPDGGLGVIDFQDAVIGPVTYDAVSYSRTAMCSGTARISCGGLSNIGSNWRGMIWRLVPASVSSRLRYVWFAAPPEGAWGFCAPAFT